ncbi:MAG TPA: hypothetical protein VGU20_03150 [Stellaceae bacterium]|nr:hypothetical protein [Stellaceae bacterium]
MSFAGDDLVLGAGTCLAQLRRGAPSIDGQEGRILTLLSVAYWRPIPTQVLKLIRAAVRAYGRGEKVLASIHLAHAGLPTIERTNADREFCRLFLAGRLLSAGVTPLRLLDGLGINTAPIRLLKASPDDPNHPGWPTGTPGGRGGKFRPRNGGGDAFGVPGPAPVADFSGGFHDVVVKAWVDYFRKHGIPVVTKPGLRLIGANDSIIGFPDMMVKLPGTLGLTVIEVKTGGDPPPTPNQAAYIPVLQIGGHIYSTDSSITNLGLVPGVPFPPLPVVILYAPGPNQPYESWELPPPQFEP